jgi:hypothetical protein
MQWGCAAGTGVVSCFEVENWREAETAALACSGLTVEAISGVALI